MLLFTISRKKHFKDYKNKYVTNGHKIYLQFSFTNFFTIFIFGALRKSQGNG